MPLPVLSLLAALNTFGDASCVADDPRSPTVNVQLKEIAPSNASVVQLPVQPADRPFAQLLGRGTTALPRRFHVILQAKDQPTSKRAQQLRSTLSHDLKLLLGYLCIVLSPLALSLFMSLGGQETLNAVESWHLSYTWTVRCSDREPNMVGAKCLLSPSGLESCYTCIDHGLLAVEGGSVSAGS